jgi:hypothetical protein
MSPEPTPSQTEPWPMWIAQVVGRLVEIAQDSRGINWEMVDSYTIRFTTDTGMVFIVQLLDPREGGT